MRPLLALVLLACACGPAKKDPTGEDGAKYLGFVAGKTLTYAVDESSESHEHKASSVASEDGVTVDMIAKDGGGFVVEDRSFTLEITAETASLVRFSDCINPCGTPKKKLPFLDWPLEAGASYDTTTTVALTNNGEDAGEEEQTHTIVVGDPESVTVPAGSFDEAFAVTWTITRGEDVQTHVLSVVPDHGIVRWETADGKTLELR